VLLLKLSCCFESGLGDFGGESIDISRTFLQGDGVAGYKICRRHYGGKGWLEVSCFGYVKGEDGVSSCDGEVW
jgi:hypothetical protein